MKKPKKRKAAAPAAGRRRLLDVRKKEWMLAVLIRNPAAFAAVADFLTKEDLLKLGTPHGVIWEIVCDFHAKHGELPGRTWLARELRSLADASEQLGDVELEEAESFLEYAYDAAEVGRGLHRKPAYADEAVRTCEMMLEEQRTASVRDVLLLTDGTIPRDTAAILRASAEKIDAARGLRGVDVGPVFHEGWDQEDAVEMIPTGIAAFDNFLGGGWVGGEVVEFMGPYGSCKTVVAIQATVEAAKYWQEKHAAEETGGRRPLVFLISTEMGIKEFRLRVLSHAAQIPVKRLRMAMLKGLCDEPKPGATPETQYELEEFAGYVDNPEAFDCERVRAERGMALVNESIVFLECTDADPQGALVAGVPDLARWVDSILRKRPDCYPAHFTLDHAAALASRIVEKTDRDASERIGILRDIPLHCGSLLAKKYNASFLLTHQLSGEANSRSPVAAMHHTDADGCKSFATYADFAIVTGQPTQDKNQLAVFRCTKHRREPPAQLAIVAVEGAFGRVRLREGYTLDPGKHTIVSEEEHTVRGTKKKFRAAADDDTSGVEG